MRRRATKHEIKLRDQIEHSTDLKIDAVLDELKLRSSSQFILTPEDRKLIIRDLALRKAPREILDDVNHTRQLRGETPITSAQLKLAYFRTRYAEAIDRCYGIYSRDVAKVYTFSDKFRRIGVLNDLADRFKEHIDRNETIDADFRQNTAMLLRILNALHQEMGVAKYTFTKVDVEHKKSEPDLSEILEQYQGDPKKLIEHIITQRYKDQLGIEEAEFEELTPYKRCAFYVPDRFCTYPPKGDCIAQIENKKCNDFIDNERLNDKDWLEQQYITNKLSLKVISNLLGRTSDPDNIVKSMIRDKLWEFNLQRKSQHNSKADDSKSSTTAST